MWRVHDWVCVHVLGGHKEAINDIAVHPSGKLALSVSKDNTMKLWNLVHGRCGFTRRLKGSADRVAWDATGEHYLLLANGTVQVYAAADNSCLTTLVHPCRVSQALFANLHYGQILTTNSTTNGEEDIDPFASLHFVTLTADTKTLYIYTLAGVKVASLNLASLGGRPKDMQIFQLDLEALARPVQNAGLAEALIQAGELAAVACSAGHMHVISLEAACRGLPLEACVLTTAQLRSEPRLVSLAVTPCYKQKQKKNGSSTSITSVATTSSRVGDEVSKPKAEKTGKRKPDLSDTIDDNSNKSQSEKKVKKHKNNKQNKNHA